MIINFFLSLPFEYFGKNYLRRVDSKIEEWYIGNATVFTKNEIDKCKQILEFLPAVNSLGKDFEVLKAMQNMLYDTQKTAELFCGIVNKWKALGGWPLVDEE